MEFDVRYSSHPQDARHLTTGQLRERFLIDTLFVDDRAMLAYSHFDRIIAGGIQPVRGPIALEAGKELGTKSFLERRELGIINVGGPGIVTVGADTFALASRDGLYVGMGQGPVSFASDSAASPAKFYLNSAPAHKAWPTEHIPLARAKKINLGDAASANVRTINQYIHPAVCPSCQLVMGLTELALGSCWNTMPCHTHERRMEVYFYFNMASDTRVFHLMGEASETRHLVVANEQAVISPSWSIHSGVGTGRYSFIWGMVGENMEFTDMDFIPMDSLK